MKRTLNIERRLSDPLTNFENIDVLTNGDVLRNQIFSSMKGKSFLKSVAAVVKNIKAYYQSKGRVPVITIKLTKAIAELRSESSFR